MRIDTSVVGICTLVYIFTGESIAPKSGLAYTCVVGTQVSALCILVARMSLCAEIGALANVAALIIRSNLICAVELGTLFCSDFSAV